MRTHTPLGLSTRFTGCHLLASLLTHNMGHPFTGLLEFLISFSCCILLRIMSENITEEEAARVARNLLLGLPSVVSNPAPASPQSLLDPIPSAPQGSSATAPNATPGPQPARAPARFDTPAPAAPASAASLNPQGSGQLEFKEPLPASPSDEPAAPSDLRHLLMRRLLRALPIASDEQLQQVVNVFTQSIPPAAEPGTPPRNPISGFQPPPPPPLNPTFAPNVPLGPPQTTGYPQPVGHQATDPLSHLLPQASNKRSG